MDDRLAEVESTVRELRESLARLERRLTALERGHAAAVPDEADAALLGAALPRVERADFIGVLSFIGRSFVALGGAYLLRAITDAHIVPPAVGIALGLAYGVGWVWMADRAAAAHQRLNAAFHEFVAAIIVFPLLWEATVRFAVLTPAWTAGALAIVAALMVGVAIRRRVQVVAWIATLASLTATIGLVAATGVVIPFSIWLIAFGVATLWIGYAYDWVLLRWPVALFADVVVLGLTMRASRGEWLEPPMAVVAVQLLLLNAYVASIVIRTLVRARNVNAFEVVQTLAALTVGFGGAVYVAHVTGAGVITLALVNMAAGAGCYAVAFAFVAGRQGVTRNFYFYTTLALILILVSSPMLLEGRALALVWAALALTATAGARGTGRVTLLWHGVAYLFAAATVSGAVQAASDALIGSASEGWRPFSGTALIVITASMACWIVAAGLTAGTNTRTERGTGVGTGVGTEATLHAARFLLASIVIWTIGGWLVAMATPPLCGTPGAGAVAGALATIRTTVLASAALLVAWLGGRPRFHEASWVLYPVLIAGGLKLLFEDLPRSEPATLFIALAFYGGALILAPRLIHRPAASH